MTLADCVIRGAQQVVVTASAWLSGEKAADLSVVGGSITADSRRSVMRDGSAELAPTADLAHLGLYQLIGTPGLELAFHRGFRLADGTDLLAPLGRFVVDELSYKRTQSGTNVSVSFSDLSLRVARARWTDAYAIASGTALATALTDLLADRAPTLVSAITSDVCPATLGAKVTTEAGESSNPWADACGLAEAHGYVLYVDPDGVARVRPAPTLNPDAAVFAFAPGATAITTEQTRTTTMEGTYNGVIASGEGSDVETAVRGEAWDDNPASATYRYGPFGQVPRFYSSPLLTTAAQCEEAAASILTGLLGRTETLSWAQVVHPGLRPLDVITLEAEGTTRAYIIDSLTIPLEISGTMAATAREIAASW